ncbi:MAG: GNAT family N-acetyltransferase [Candidatus Eremiobacteraeota bacterium]|nr:GNAT family N-acetyltransferase [Candidatus Eremiobacteraeota bacterium]
MLTDNAFEVHALPCKHFHIAADFWLAMRQEVGISGDDLPPDWKQRAIAYFTRRHAAGELMWFFAWKGVEPAGSGCGLILDGYPSAICTQRRWGYIAGIYVKPQYRRRGLARDLTLAAESWLRGRGCTNVRLRASPAGRPLYAPLGFEGTNEMEHRRA